MCDRDGKGVSSIFNVIRNTTDLTRMFSILDLNWEENVTTLVELTLVMGNLMGRRFWVGRGYFFLWGKGRVRGNDRTVLLSRFRRTT